MVTIDSQRISSYEESKSYIADRFQGERLRSSDSMGRKEPVSAEYMFLYIGRQAAYIDPYIIYI